jgi:hypothetical protein
VRDLLFFARKLLGKVHPRRIVALDEPDFLLAAPTFDFLLTRNGVANVRELLKYGPGGKCCSAP